jgi:hypothetical protein
MQRMKDRQKTLAVHGVLMSDEPSQVAVLDYRDLKSVEGRVLVHGEEEGWERGWAELLNARRDRYAGPSHLLHGGDRRGTEPEQAPNQFFRSSP